MVRFQHGPPEKSCEYGEIGRRAGLRIQFLTEWGFESLYSHQIFKRSSRMSQVQSPAFSLRDSGPQFSSATVVIPSDYVRLLYEEASDTQKTHIHTHGFSRGDTPLSYIQKNFQPHLIEHIKEFLFKYFVINSFYEELHRKKIFLAGEPLLQDVNTTPTNDLSYTFSLTLAQPIALHGWKRLPFKAPKRKNYKDLDRQVENFLKDEELFKKKAPINVISIGDWVNFTVLLLNKWKEPIFPFHKENLWIKIGSEEADIPFQSLFLHKLIGEKFITNDECIQEYFSTHLDTNYTFLIEIADVLHQSYFCIEHFKKHFRIKTVKEIHQKLVEVFSYRNDISQRRATAEETLKLLLARHPFSVPPHLILRQQKTILDIIAQSPDYQVYKMQPDFNYKTRMLAERQMRENMLINQLAIHEGIDVTNADIKGYLNLSNRQRTAEFIYFEPPATKFLGHESPISTTLLTLSCLKEKTLNHAIHHLTRNRSGI